MQSIDVYKVVIWKKKFLLVMTIVDDVISGPKVARKSVSAHFLKQYYLRSHHTKKKSIQKTWTIFPHIRCTITVILLQSLPDKRRWYLPGLVFILLSLHQFKSLFPSPYFVGCCIVSITGYVFVFDENKLLRKILKSMGHRIDPWGTPNKIFAH